MDNSIYDSNSGNVPGSSPVLAVAGLGKEYGKLLAVFDVSFTVGRQEIVGLLGPNGAGKTTIISMVLGILEPTSGTIRIEDMDVTGQRVRALMRTNFAAVYAPLPGNLTVFENLHIFGLLYGVRDVFGRVDELIEQFHLGRFRDMKCGLLSSGEQMRVCLAKSMLNRPDLLLLDEPTASLDPARAHDVRSLIREFVAQGGGGVLWTSQNMYEVEEVCDRVLFLSHGRIVLEGDPKTLPRTHGKKTLEELFIAVEREPLKTEQA
ncbi:MAG: ABC transporter ATP-binding protein [Gammaproteobacteria bacterium]